MTRLDEIQQREQKATPGPMEVVKGENFTDFRPVGCENRFIEVHWPSFFLTPEKDYQRCRDSFKAQAEADASFYADARTDIPHLLSLVKDLGEALKAWQRFASHCAERNITVPLWAAALNEDAVVKTSAALKRLEEV